MIFLKYLIYFSEIDCVVVIVVKHQKYHTSEKRGDDEVETKRDFMADWSTSCTKRYWLIGSRYNFERRCKKTDEFSDCTVSCEFPDHVATLARVRFKESNYNQRSLWIPCGAIGNSCNYLLQLISGGNCPFLHFRIHRKNLLLSLVHHNFLYIGTYMNISLFIILSNHDSLEELFA